MSYIEVIDKIIDSKDITVGGGSASAISGAMAAGLIGMVARLSTRKDYGLIPEEYISIANELDSLGKELLEGAEEDAKAYMMIIDAYALPKATEEEKAKRSEAIAAAGASAAKVPKNNAYLCKKVYELGLYLDGKSNDNAHTDLKIGLNLAKIGIEGCRINIEVNLSLIKDEKIKNELQEHVEKLK